MLVALVATARAQQSDAQSLWQAPTSCPAPAGLRPAGSGESKPKAWVVVQQVEGGFSATIHAEYAGGKGSRVLNAGSCEEVRSAALVALSLIDPLAVPAPPSVAEGSVASDVGAAAAAPSELQPGEQPSSQQQAALATAGSDAQAAGDGSAVGSTPNPRAFDADEPRPLLSEQSKPIVLDPLAAIERPGKVVRSAVPPRQEAGVHSGAHATPLAVGLAASAGFQGVQRPLLGGAADLVAELEVFRVRAELGLRMSAGSVAASDEVALDLLLAGLRVEVCRAWQPWTHELLLCAGPQLQFMRGSAPQLAQPLEQSVWLPGGGATAKLWWLRHLRVSFWTAAQLEVRYHRVDYRIDEQGRVGSFGRFSAVLLAGPQFKF